MYEVVKCHYYLFWGGGGRRNKIDAVHQFAFSYTCLDLSLVMNYLINFFICSFHTYSPKGDNPLQHMRLNEGWFFPSVSSQVGETEGVVRDEKIWSWEWTCIWWSKHKGEGRVQRLVGKTALGILHFKPLNRRPGSRSINTFLQFPSGLAQCHSNY